MIVGRRANRTPLLLALSALALVLAAPSPARSDDRPPTPEERAAIEQVLGAQGYSAWEEIELDDDVWEVDDAVHSDGRKYDLTLAPGDLAVVEREED
jgi:hypothetical protein